MTNATKRSILRWVHLIVTIPILGYIYGKPSDVEQYAGGVRYLFVPIIILSGYWMYGGIIFAMLGAALWLGAFRLSGFGAALLSQIALFIGRKIWLMMRARRRQADIGLTEAVET
ncbi:MAG TPA: hypothetical protein VLI90_04970 [Tepidisphaeraceae bacterium]|nr:hypothetical protein [Tepidisphaeraceae bacterium]